MNEERQSPRFDLVLSFQYNIIYDSRGVAQFGRALRLGRRGRRFKSYLPDLIDCQYNHGNMADVLMA